MTKWIPEKIPAIIIGVLIASIIPIFIPSGFALHILVLLGVWIVLALSLNFVTGFAGQLALGHAAFVTIGGYSGALIMIRFGVSFWIGLLIAGLTSFISGAILGILAMRLRGDYLGMVTLGFGEIIRLLALNLTDITRGPMGLPGVPRISVFGISFQSIIPHFYLILFFILLTFYFIKRLIFSRFGRACRAVRDDEKAAEAMGIKSYKIKVISFCISAGLAGLMGAFYASWITFFSPDSFQFNDSIMMSAMITFGGIGSLYGPIFGAISIGSLPEILRPFTSGVGVASLRLAGVGLIMVLMLIIKPEGLFGDSITERYLSLRWLKDWLRKKKNKKIHNFKERQ